MLAAGVGKKRKSSLGHPIPKRFETRIIAIDILAIRQALHHHRAGFQASLEFIHRVGSGRVYGHGREEFRVLAGQLQNNIIGHKSAPVVFQQSSICVINRFLSQKAYRVYTGFSYVM